ncbi:hypothetical protein PMAYCL1PPCAC_11647, partial [Pristionchus mayeri]
AARITWTSESVVQILVAALAIVGCRQLRSLCIIPSLVYFVLLLVLHVAAIISTVVLMTRDTKDKDALAPVIIAVVISFVIHLWFLTIFKNCYKYLRELERPTLYDDI